MTLLRSCLGQLRAKCRCSSCSQATRVTRSSNGTNPIGTRAFQTGTVLYTAIFAAATLVDGEQKKLRRERWDEAIAVKKEEARTAKDNLMERTRQVASKRFGVREPLPDEAADRLLRKLESSLRAQAVSRANGGCERVLDEETVRLLHKLESSLQPDVVPHQKNVLRSFVDRETLRLIHQLEGSLQKRPGEPKLIAPQRRKLIKQFPTEPKPQGIPSYHPLARYVKVRQENKTETSHGGSSSLLGSRSLFDAPPELPARHERTILISHYTGPSWDQEGKSLADLTLRHTPYLGPVAPLIPSTTPVEYHHPQSPWRLAVKRHRTPKELPWTNKKRGRVELGTMTFVMKLLRETNLCGLSEEELPALPQSLWGYASLSEGQLENALQELEHELISTQPLATSAYRPPPDIGLLVPRYSPERDEEVHVLHQGLEHLMKRSLVWTEIARLCAMILQSPASPNIDTCNLLLIIFNKQERHDLVDITFDWMVDTRLRPNEMTHVEFLRSYRRRNDEPRFMTYISLMRGMKSGLMMADRLPDFLLPRMQGRVFPVHEGGSRLVQAVAPSPLVFNQIILGLLNFCGVNRTWDVCQNFVEYGWGYSYNCLRTLIIRCAIESAWDAGLRWWAEADKIVSQGYPIPQALYTAMLAFYRIAEKNEDYTKLLSEAEYRLGVSSLQMADLVGREEFMIMKIRTGSLLDHDGPDDQKHSPD